MHGLAFSCYRTNLRDQHGTNSAKIPLAMRPVFERFRGLSFMPEEQREGPRK